jgi:hypothetical protein
MVEAVKDFQGLHVNVSPGDGMFGPGNDVRWNLRRPYGFGLHLISIVKFFTFFNPLILNNCKISADSAPNSGKNRRQGGIIDKRGESIYF